MNPEILNPEQANVRVLLSHEARGDRMIFLFADDPLPPAIGPDEFAAEAGDMVITHGEKDRTLYVGMGDRTKAKPHTWRKATASAARHLDKKGSTRIQIHVPDDCVSVDPIVEGALLGLYRYDRFLDEKRKNKPKVANLDLVVSPSRLATAKEEARQAALASKATNWMREIGNTPPNIMTPAALAAQAKALASRSGIQCRILEPTDLEKEGMGGILAVGSGSVNTPRLIVLEWMKGEPGEPVTAVVGKAITFDSGGYCIKPPASMPEMKFDKMGGCAVLGIMAAAADLGLRRNLVGVIASAENLIDGEAYRPGDVLTTCDGKTVEVIDTDAEGRLVLADAIAHARQKYRPDLILEMSTLTGACMVALGTDRAGIFTDHEPSREKLIRIGESTGERLWHLPIGDEYEEAMRSDIAFIKNLGSRQGGASSAASFLRKWAEDIPFVHLDIAGPASIEKDVPHACKGASGFGVRLITRFLFEKP